MRTHRSDCVRGRSSPGVTERPRSFYAGMAAVLGGVLLASRMFEPPRRINVCLFNLVTGLPCMTCGLTRAFHAISAGRLREACAYHPLGLVLYGLAVFHLAVACLRLLGWRRRLVRGANRVRAMVYGVMGVLLLVWVPRLLSAVVRK